MTTFVLDFFKNLKGVWLHLFKYFVSAIDGKLFEKVKGKKGSGRAHEDGRVVGQSEKDFRHVVG